MSITGFDDIELARIVSPELTTVHVPHREMGQQRAIELTAMVEKTSAGKSEKLDSHLQIRESLGVQGMPARLNGALKSGRIQHPNAVADCIISVNHAAELAIIDLFRDPAVRAAAHPLMGLWVWMGHVFRRGGTCHEMQGFVVCAG